MCCEISPVPYSLLFFDQTFSAARQRVFFVFFQKCFPRPYTFTCFTAANTSKNASKKHAGVHVRKWHPRAWSCVFQKCENQIPPCCLGKHRENWCLQVPPRKIGVRCPTPLKIEIKAAGEKCQNRVFLVVCVCTQKISRKHEKTRKFTFRPWASKWFFDFFRELQF